MKKEDLSNLIDLMWRKANNMPKIEKQIPNSDATLTRISAKKIQRSPKQSVWDRIVPIQSLKKGIKLVLYGRTKTGKTRIASSFPKPMLILGSEDGTSSISTIEDINFLHLQRSSDVSDAVAGIEGRYRTVVLDHASGLQDLVLKEILGLDELPIQREWGMANQQDWGACGAQMKDHLLRLLTLATKGIADIVIIAHDRSFKDEGVSSDVMMPSIGPALQPSTAGWLNGQADYIGNTYIREGVKVIRKLSKRTDKEGKPLSKEVTIKTGKKEYCLRVGPHEVFMTGFRLPPGASLPESISDPNYTKIVSLINGNTLP